MVRETMARRQIIPPVGDCLRWQVMAALDQAGMFAQDTALGRVTPKACFQHDDQPVGIDSQADRAIGEWCEGTVAPDGAA